MPGERSPCAQVVAAPHFLLATLLLCNSVAMEALPLFLDRLFNPVAAIVISGALLDAGSVRACLPPKQPQLVLPIAVSPAVHRQDPQRCIPGCSACRPPACSDCHPDLWRDRAAGGLQAVWPAGEETRGGTTAGRGA